jgi:hypothetical protein
VFLGLELCPKPGRSKTITRWVCAAEINEAARFEIFNLRAVSVNEQERITCSAIDVMQAHPVDLKELANRRMTLFCVARLSPSA